MVYWKATVERPDGAGGWVVVDVFGVPNHPGGYTAQYLHGDTAFDAAKLLLSHLWPINLAQHNERADPGKWHDRVHAGDGLADHRITLVVDEKKSWLTDGKSSFPEPATYTVGELRLAEIRAEGIELAEAQAKLKELTAQIKKARSDVSYHRYCKKEAAEAAARAGVPAADIARATRVPRQRKKTT